MKKQTYSDQLKSPLWQKKRLEILERDEFKCKYCGENENTLHVHHKRYKKDAKPWQYENDNFVTLCENCHKIIHHLDKCLRDESLDIYSIKDIEIMPDHHNLYKIKSLNKFDKNINQTAYTVKLDFIIYIIIMDVKTKEIINTI